ncbi:MAG TPA: SpoIIE family protein phosphatase, partial [Bdellovibrionota bacterium]|nr:SpoIIE family protein phosphatase [Bdellovibrionota bacterium]
MTSQSSPGDAAPGPTTRPQKRIALSVGTKLLIGIVATLGLVIIFLNLSTIFILKEDKRAYVYQSQSTAAMLIGREFKKTLRHALDTMRVSLASIDPLKAVGPAEIETLKTIIRNQSELLHLGVMLLDQNAAAARSVANVAREVAAGEQARPDPVIASVWWKSIMEDLLKGGYAFVNLSSADDPALIGILAADLRLKDNPAGMPVALGLISLKGLGQEARGLSLTIATRSGWVLYDTTSSKLLGRMNISDDPLFDLARNSTASAGASEYDFQGNHLLGSYVNLPFDISILARTDWQSAIRSTYTLTEKFIFLGLMAIGAAIVFAIFFSRSLTAPINRLYDATFDIAKGNFDINLKSASKDEIGVLTESFNNMSRQIHGLIVEREKKAAIEHELAVASTVQQTLIPAPSFRDERILVHSHYQAASQCGGDWWGHFQVGGRTCILIADATGHGFPSALITASARSCFTVLHKLAREHGHLGISPVTMLHYADQVVYEASAAKIMMTMFIGLIDFDQRTLTYANAGHNPPWLFQREPNG